MPDERMQRRGGRYHLRVRVPDDLRPIVGKGEIKRTLGTGDYREALRRLEPRREVSDHELRQMALLWFVRHERDMARREEADPPDRPDDYRAALRASRPTSGI